MILVLLANGFEEIEALTTVDILRRAGLDVKTVGIDSVTEIGSHNISVVCDDSPEGIEASGLLNKVTMAIFPGGMPGSVNLDASTFTDKVIEAVINNGGRLAAICAAPLVLGRRGLLKGRKATCYPGFENELIGATVVDKSVVTDGSITTARGMGVALDFALELVSLLKDKETASRIASEICMKGKRSASGAKVENESPKLPVFDSEELNETAQRISDALCQLKIKASIVDAKQGARYTRYTIAPNNETNTKKLLANRDDIALLIEAQNIRMTCPTEDLTVFLELPRKKGDIVPLDGILQSDEFLNAKSPLSVCIGRDFDGAPVICDLAKLPHLLIGGATGMGKSLFIHSLIKSICTKSNPDQVRFILIDPKWVEFSMYRDLPHLLTPIIYDPKQAVGALCWAVEETDRRYTLMIERDARNIDAYNEAVGAENALPKIVIIIDELADLMLQVRKEAESYITRIVQKARAAGIHIIIATQRPSPNVITGIIKANIPSRISMRVMSHKDSITVLDTAGAERLLGSGDALFMQIGTSMPRRVQTPYLSNQDISDISYAKNDGVINIDTEAITEKINELAGRLFN